MKNRGRLLLAAIAVLAVGAAAHDGWIQSNVARVRLGDMVYIDMQFGNHGNTHRDYKIYQSKWSLTDATFTLHTPSGLAVDMRDTVIDVGQDTTVNVGGTPYLDKNGYLVTSFKASETGPYIMDVRQDMVVSYAPERSIKCTKSVVMALPSTQGRATGPYFPRVLGQVLELVPLGDPTDLKAGKRLPIQVLFKGAPAADVHVSVIPRGKVLAAGMDPRYDLMTDMDGMFEFEFDEANYHLIVAHVETNEGGILGGKTYTFTKYAAALTVIVGPDD